MRRRGHGAEGEDGYGTHEGGGLSKHGVGWGRQLRRTLTSFRAGRACLRCLGHYGVTCMLAVVLLTIIFFALSFVARDLEEQSNHAAQSIAQYHELEQKTKSFLDRPETVPESTTNNLDQVPNDAKPIEKMVIAFVEGTKTDDARRLIVGNRESFTCPDGYGGRLLFDRINDGFCDCPGTGFDEPGTSACSGLADSFEPLFYCGDRDGAFLHSSRVQDGVCDCCDGSDEHTSRCEDRCDAQSKRKSTAKLRGRSRSQKN